MLCYMDMTFCGEKSCANFGKDCDRSLTEDVVRKAAEFKLNICIIKKQVFCLNV